jgi:5-hydroxyisourate hydrolase-like protein (transthyretin family)
MAAAQCQLGYANQLTGTVSDDHNGDPLSGVRVRLFDLVNERSLADTSTSSSGEFAFSDLPGGEYRLEFSKSNLVTTDVRVSIPASGSHVSVRLVRLGVITGRVYDSDGQPTDGVLVAAFVKSDNGDLKRCGGSIKVNPNGEYRIHSLPPGQYAVAAYRHQEIRRTLYSVADEIQFVDIEAGTEVRNVDLVWNQGASFEVGGHISGGDSKTSYSVTLAPKEQPGISPIRSFAPVNGRFVFGGVPPGTYVLLAVAHRTQENETGTTALYGRAEITVDDSDVEGVALDVEVGKSLDITLGTSGTAPTSENCPQSITVILKPHNPWLGARKPPVQLGVDQHKIVEDLAPDFYDIEATNLPTSCFLTTNGHVDTRRERSVLEVELIPAGSIQGRVQRASVDTSGFTVTLTRRGPSGIEPITHFAAADASGRFEFDNLRPGLYLILALPSQKRLRPKVSQMAEVEVFPGSPTVVDLPALHPE